MCTGIVCVYSLTHSGRLIFDNLKKTIAYTVTHLVPEIAAYLAYVAVSVPLGLGSITLLFIDVGTDIVPAVTLAYERPENDIMLRSPRNPVTDRLVNAASVKVSFTSTDNEAFFGGNSIEYC